MKTCSRCNDSLPLSEFGKHRKAKDGKQAWCKPCQRQYAAVRQDQLAARAVIDIPPSKRCPRCDEIKDSDQFHRTRGTRDGLQTYCTQCSLIVNRESLERNAEVVAAKRAEKLLHGSHQRNGEKTCTRCGETKQILSFYLHRGTRDGRATHCAECQRVRAREWNAANRERISTRNAAYAAANPDQRKRDHRQFWLRMYGLTQDSYSALVEKQDGVCAICLLPERYIDGRTGELRRLSVDHDHESGKVRGLLCGRCNRSIGQFAHDHERLSRAAAYLREAAD